VAAIGFLQRRARALDQTHIRIFPEICGTSMAAELPHLFPESLAFQRSTARGRSSLHCSVENEQERVAMLSADVEQCMNKILDTCMPRLLRAADCVLHNHHDSEDALQDALLSALRHINQFKGNSHLSTWLYSIVRNSALGKLRKRRAHPLVPFDDHEPDQEIEHSEWTAAPTDPSPNPERGCAQTELSLRFDRMLETLPKSYRTIIHLCDFEGFSGKEAAQQLGLSVSAVKAQHHRARLAIRKSIRASNAHYNRGLANARGARPLPRNAAKTEGPVSR
jgi:RNA polymerase sigma-70 factor (ECF subfamily)